MSTSNPSLSIRELTKPIEERMKNVEMVMENVVRERDSLKKHVDLLEKTQTFTILEKYNLKEKLTKSEEKCKEIERKYEELRVKHENLESEMLAILKLIESGNHEEKEKEEKEEDEEEEKDFDEGARSPQAPSELLQEKGARYLVKVDRRYDLEIINIIKNKLQQENLEKNFHEQSCFRDLMKLHEHRLEFQGQLMLHLVQHLDKDASNEERGLVFNIDNSIMVFQATDFGHITGLDVGRWDWEATKTSSSIHKDVFKGRSKIKLTDIYMAFLQVSGGSEVALKLASLYFLYGILLPGNDTIEPSEMRFLHLVDDLDEFNAFPWGRVAYQFLVKSILTVQKRMAQKRHKRYAIHGFSCALQAWVYEVMPSVAEYCAKKVGNLTPQILCWSANKGFRYCSFNKFFRQGTDKPHLSKRMGVEEMKSDQHSIEGGSSRKGTGSIRLLAHSKPAISEQDNVGKNHEIRGSDGEVGAADVVIPVSDSDDEEPLVFRRSNKRIKRDGDSRSPLVWKRRSTPASAPSAAHDCDSGKPLVEKFNAAAAIDVDSSDDESCSDSHMAKLVAGLES